ncbi:hypothetical protein HDU77_011282 [Chytriomyces hyalinus]|nr:hypothetical protein HDU77_011282 [Chytriomyces hyalinus]
MTTSTDDFNLSSDSDQSLPHSGQLRNQRRLSAKERDLLHAQALAHFNQPQQHVVGAGGVTSNMRGSALERKGSAGTSVRSSKSELHSPISIPPLDYKRRNMDLNLGFIGSELSNSYGLQDNNHQQHHQQQPHVESLLSQSEYFREIPFPGNPSNTAAYPSQVSASPSIHSMASGSADYEGVGQHAQVRSFVTAPRRPGTRQERTASLALSHGYSPSITDSQHQTHSAPTTPTAASLRERGASVGINTRPLTDMQSPASSPTSQLHHNISSQHAPIPSPLNIAPAMLRTNPLSNIASASGLTSQPFNPLSSNNNVESPSASTPSYPQLSIYRSPSNASFAFDQATTPITPRNMYADGRQSGDDLFDSNTAFQMPIHMQNLQLQQTQSRDASDNGSVSSKSAKSVKVVSNGNKHNEPIHPIVSSPPIRLNLVGRAKSISGSTTTANGEGAVRSSGESHMSGESDKSSGTDGKREKIKEKVVNVAFGPPVKLNLQRRKSEIHVKQKSLLDESASVVSKGDSKADAVLQGMFQGNHGALLGKLSRGLSQHKKNKRSQSPHSGNDSSDTAPQASPPTRLPNSIPRADFIHLRSSSPSNASVHYMEGSENVVFMAPTPLPGVRSGETGTGSEDELIRDTTGMPPRPRGKSFSSINEESEGGEGSALSKFRAKRAAEKAAKRGF